MPYLYDAAVPIAAAGRSPRRKGLTMKRRKHTFTLRFDNGPDERIIALSTTAAVAARINQRMPYSITDETILSRWLDHGRKP